MKIPMFIMQGFGSFFGLILIPTLMLRAWRQPVTQFFDKKNPPPGYNPHLRYPDVLYGGEFRIY